MLRNSLDGLVAESSMKFLQILARGLARLTFSTNGLRVDVQTGTVATVTTVAASNNVALGRATADGMGIQASQMAYNCGFRRNIQVV